MVARAQPDHLLILAVHDHAPIDDRVEGVRRRALHDHVHARRERARLRRGRELLDHGPRQPRGDGELLEQRHLAGQRLGSTMAQRVEPPERGQAEDA